MAEMNSEITVNITPEMRQAMAEHSAVMERVEKKLDERIKLDAEQLKRHKTNLAMAIVSFVLNVVLIILLVKR